MVSVERQDELSSGEKRRRLRLLRRKYGLVGSGLSGGGLLREILRRSFMRLVSGERYYGFRYSGALECARYTYRVEGLRDPFVVVCENPYEAYYVCRAMEELWECGDSGFMGLFSRVRDLVRSGGSDGEVEVLSRELFMYVLPYAVERCKVVRGGGGDEFLDMLGPSGAFKDSMLAVSMFTDLYYGWFDFCEAYGLPYWVGRGEFERVHSGSGIFLAFLREDVWVVSKYPKRLVVDLENMVLHSVEGSVVEWGYSHEVFRRDYYCIRGRRVPSWLFEKGFTYDDFLRVSNEEVRAAMYEIVVARGAEYMLDFFRLEVVDRKVVRHRVVRPVFGVDGSYVGDKECEEEEELVLYHTRDGVRGTVDPVSREVGGKMAFIEFRCPSTGVRYMIYTSNTFRDVVEAAKYARPFYHDSAYEWVQRS